MGDYELWTRYKFIYEGHEIEGIVTSLNETEDEITLFWGGVSADYLISNLSRPIVEAHVYTSPTEVYLNY